VGSDQPLFYQIQMLQQELRDLRGTVEEQAYLIQKLQSSQRSQYVDLDRRMTALAPNRPAPGPTPMPMADGMTEGSESLEGTQSSAPSVSLPQSETNVQPTTEREAYAQAIELMRGKRFDESTQAFGALIVKYPNGQYTPNAFYWLGELNLATGQIEPARQNFVQVIRLYPDHQKVPDALYKLGVLYFQLGDEAESRRYLQQVQSEYPQSSAGTLAKRYLAEME
jgi:tol-pal system protein YbgF